MKCRSRSPLKASARRRGSGDSNMIHVGLAVLQAVFSCARPCVQQWSGSGTKKMSSTKTGMLMVQLDTRSRCEGLVMPSHKLSATTVRRTRDSYYDRYKCYWAGKPRSRCTKQGLRRALLVDCRLLSRVMVKGCSPLFCPVSFGC